MKHSVHLEHSSESNFTALHMIERLLSLGEREGLNHAFDIVNLCEPDSLLAIEGMPRWPSMDREALQNKG